jgi:hypothetical protein
MSPSAHLQAGDIGGHVVVIVVGTEELPQTAIVMERV